MAEDVQVFSGGSALAAARLCNLPTGQSTLLGAHARWIDSRLIPTLASSVKPWIDIIGYASKLGSTEPNHQLSARRCEAVKAYIASKNPKAQFNIQLAKGESESLGSETNDDGCWRAVDVHGYGSHPPQPTAPTLPVGPQSTNFKIRMYMAFSGTVPIVDGPQGDLSFFEIVDVARRRHAMFRYLGAGLALPNFITMAFLSGVGAGPFTSFRTSQGERLESFQGEASLYQDPGVTVGPGAVGGTFRLALRSRTLTTRRTLVLPSIVPITSGFGFSISASSATQGSLRMAWPESAYNGL